MGGEAGEAKAPNKPSGSFLSTAEEEVAGGPEAGEGDAGRAGDEVTLVGMSLFDTTAAEEEGAGEAGNDDGGDDGGPRPRLSANLFASSRIPFETEPRRVLMT